VGLAPIERVSTSSLTKPLARKILIGLLTDAEGDGMNPALIPASSAAMNSRMKA
jgi:hypothetical protein